MVAALVGVATAASDVMAASRPPATKKPQESILRALRCDVPRAAEVGSNRAGLGE